MQECKTASCNGFYNDAATKTTMAAAAAAHVGCLECKCNHRFPCHFYRNKSLGEHQLSLLLSVRDSKMIHLYLTGATLPRVSIPGSLPLLTYMMRASSCKSARLFADGCLLWVLMSGMICHSL